MVKNLPVMQETWVWSLGGEDPLEKGMANPLQYSSLENSMDSGVWWATVHGVPKSQTWLCDSHTHTHTHTHTRGSCCVAQGAQISALWWPIGVGLEGDWKVLEGGDICIHKVGSLPCTAETNTRRKAIILQVLKIPLNPTISWILSAWE